MSGFLQALGIGARIIKPVMSLPQRWFSGTLSTSVKSFSIVITHSVSDIVWCSDVFSVVIRLF